MSTILFTKKSASKLLRNQEFDAVQVKQTAQVFHENNLINTQKLKLIVNEIWKCKYKKKNPVLSVPIKKKKKNKVAISQENSKLLKTYH